MECPTCRKKLEARMDACPRCGTELTALWDLSDRAGSLCTKARSLLNAGRAADSLRLFCRADRSCSTQRSRQGIAAALLAAGRFKAALDRYLRM